MQADPDNGVQASPPLSFGHAAATADRDERDVRRRRPAPPTLPSLPSFASSDFGPDAPRSQPQSPGTHAGALLRVHFRTPNAFLGASNAYDVAPTTTVREVKDALAAGDAGFGQWERTGLRVVWRGRMLGDDEVLGSVLEGIDEPTLHFVARPRTARGAASAGLGLAGLIMNQPMRPSHTAPDVPFAPAPAPQLASAQPSASTASAALADTIHYLLFAAREHLAYLLGTPPLRWEDTVPAPAVSRDDARRAVMTVVRSYAGENDWDSVFEGDDGRLEDVWKRLGADGVKVEIRQLWRAATGREYAEVGEAVPVEFDHVVCNLHLPSLAVMTPAQLVHLVLYLRITALVPHLSAFLLAPPPTTVTPPTPTPTRTVPTPVVIAPPPMPRRVRVVYRGSIQLRVPRMSFALLSHLFWSCMRLVLALWMLTRGMKWDDSKFWLLAGGAFGWWIIDGYNMWMIEQRAERARDEERIRRAAMEAEELTRGQPQGTDGNNQGNAPALNAAQRAAADAPIHAAAAARAAGVRPRHRLAPVTQDMASLALFHLDVDSAQLRLPASSISPPRTARGGTQPAGPQLRIAPHTRPSAVLTQIFLPVYLWIATLVPALEARRARAIRQRERAMRAVVSSLTPTPEGSGDTMGLADTAAIASPVFPDGISERARKYYARVVARAEAIDWDEERDAQRAMGIPDEEAGAGAGGWLL